MENMEGLMEKGRELIAVFGLKIVAAIVIFVIGKCVAGFLRSFSMKLMTKSKVDGTLVTFLGHVIYGALLVFVILAALGQLSAFRRPHSLP